jgi:hypothetical protein
MHQYLTVRPWSQAGTLYLAFYPFVIGIGYLLALDVSFSAWFLYLVVKALNVLTAALGISEGGGGNTIANRAPFIREQGAGAFLGIALFSIWMARRTLAEAWREMRRPTGRDRDEVMGFRTAIIGGGAGLLFWSAFWRSRACQSEWPFCSSLSTRCFPSRSRASSVRRGQAGRGRRPGPQPS